QEQRVGSYVLAHPEQVVSLPITQLAEATGVSDATIFRFCRHVGTDGYQDFKIALARALVSSHSLVYADVTPEDTLASMAEKVIEASVKALQDTAAVLDVGALEQAVSVLLRARRVEIYALGGAGVAAREMQFKMMQLGMRINAFLDAQMQTMSAALLRPGDLAVGISHSGEDRHTVNALHIARQNGATTMAITNHPGSSLARAADICLVTSAEETPLEGGSPSIRIAQMAMVDLLYEGALLRGGKRLQQRLARVTEAVLHSPAKNGTTPRL
ncbi:MAG: MurR/RpiR family transcriptional regulator, partial [Anaerolineae bacterium]|nr:MurR/RpiR family transcriptional regulator [Anaerolineae bacterium]